MDKKCKHKKLKRTKEFLGDDCYGYMIKCNNCKMEITGFNVNECEEKLFKIIDNLRIKNRKELS